MILLIDIGNTSIVVGGTQRGKLLFRDRIPTHGEDLRCALSALLDKNIAAPERITGAALTSVVPEATEKILNALKENGISDPFVINCRTDTGLTLKVDRPETVGTDMIVGAAAAVHQYGAPLVLIDMGTATTFSYIDPAFNYQGHIILPGIQVSLNALLEKTAQLPPVEKLTDEEIAALKKRAKPVFADKAAFYASKLGVRYGRIAVRCQKSKWGSCSAKGNLNFNCLLLLAPETVLDYVVVHELCHRLEMNHSPRFWARVASVLPDYEARRRWLKTHGGELMAKVYD